MDMGLAAAGHLDDKQEVIEQVIEIRYSERWVYITPFGLPVVPLV